MVSTPRNTIIDQKPKRAELAERHRPGKQERHFEIEDDEEDRDEIEAHVELHARIVEGVEAALVGRELLRIGLAIGDDEGRNQQRETDHQGDADEDDERKIFLQERVHLHPLSREPMPGPPVPTRIGQTRTSATSFKRTWTGSKVESGGGLAQCSMRGKPMLANRSSGQEFGPAAGRAGHSSFVSPQDSGRL